MPRLQWIGQSATAKSSNVDSLELINMYPEIVESRQGKAAVALYSTPGLDHFWFLGGTGIRGMFVTGTGRLFAVAHTVVWELGIVGSSTAIGNLNTPYGPVSITENGLAMFIVDGFYGYTYTYSTGVFAQVVDAQFLGASHVAFVDGYFVCLRPHTNQFFWSDLYAATFDGLSIATAEGSPDLLRALLVSHRELWLFGDITTEVWYSTGAAGAGAFARIEGAVLEHGTIAPRSPTQVGETVCWLSQNTQGGGEVVQAQGLSTQRISTHAMEATLRTYARVDDAFGWAYQQGGHLFYCLAFPSGPAMWVYDAATGLWHQRAAWDTVESQFALYPAGSHAYAHGRHYVGGITTGDVYILDETRYTNVDAPLVRQAVLPPVTDADGLTRLMHTALQIDVEGGVGLDGGVVPGSQPQMLVSYSDDGGHTYTAGHHVPLGALGAYQTRARLRRLGSSRDRRYKLTYSDPTKCVILAAHVDLQGTAA